MRVSMDDSQRKEELFCKLKSRNLFWSYAPTVTLKGLGETLFLEQLLKYGELGELKEALELFGIERVKEVWMAKVAGDERFIKLNLFLARVFFGMDVETDYFRGIENERTNKLSMLAS